MKKLILAVAWLTPLAVWIGVGIYYFAADPTVSEWTIAVTAGALSLELAFWITAAVLGTTLWQSRKAVYRFLARPFRNGN